MTGVEVLSAVAGQGFVLSSGAGGQILVRGPRQPPPDVLELVRANKRVLLKLLVGSGVWVGGHLLPPSTAEELAAEAAYEREERQAIAEHGGG